MRQVSFIQPENENHNPLLNYVDKPGQQNGRANPNPYDTGYGTNQYANGQTNGSDDYNQYRANPMPQKRESIFPPMAGQNGANDYSRQPQSTQQQFEYGGQTDPQGYNGYAPQPANNFGNPGSSRPNKASRPNPLNFQFKNNW